MRERAEQHLVEHHPERVPIGGGRQRLSPALLGRHVGTCSAAPQQASVLVGEAEVEHRDLAVVVDEHVAGLEIAVDHPCAVQGSHAFRALSEERAHAGPARLLPRAPGGDRQRRAAHQIHGQVGGVLEHEQLVQPHEPGVIEPLHHAELRLDEVRAARAGYAQRLEREHLAGLQIRHLEDDPGAALPERADHLEAAREDVPRRDAEQRRRRAGRACVDRRPPGARRLVHSDSRRLALSRGGEGEHNRRGAAALRAPADRPPTWRKRRADRGDLRRPSDALMELRASAGARRSRARGRPAAAADVVHVRAIGGSLTLATRSTSRPL
ncbi:MAG: hypothetical protein M5U28_19920 [Sandaracinaceae bacterium]|nr:hypothetical protein [Sandaracinaceae bacterium]